MRIKLFCLALLSLVLSFVMPVALPSGWAPQAYAETIAQIRVEGNQRVEDETVLSYLQFSRGDQFNPERIDESIKVLFQTGLFADVQMFQRGNTLVIKLEENPLINRVNFEGNKEIDDAALAKEVEVRERMIFTKARVRSDTQRVLALYQKSGYYNVRVAPKLIRLPENRINLVFEVTEGSETKVKLISFTGNEAFSDGGLRDVIGTQQTSWWNFFQKNDTYDPDRLEYDKELLRRHYLRHGYADFSVISADVQLSPAGDYFEIAFSVEEGPRYTIADVAVNIGNTSLDPEKLKKVIKTGVGDDYNATKVDKTVENLALEASRQGFVFAKVEPKVDRNVGQGSLNISYNIAEGRRAYVEQIIIEGNTRTLDEVIRRELLIYEGDAFNRTLIERARRRLTSLDFFEKIEFQEEEGSAPDKINLVVVVTEKSTGKISFSVGYSSTEQVVGSVELSERNFMGRGQYVKLNTLLSFKRQQVDFSFTEPYFMGMPISAGFDLFATKTDNKRTSSYRSTNIGFALRTGFRLDEYSNVGFRYTLAYRDVDGINYERASPAVIAQEGSSIKSSVGATYTWDDLDNPIRPTLGFRGQLESEIAGLGGDTYYGRLEAHGWYFFPLYEESIVLKLEGNAGHIEAFNGKDVPLQDRFFKGADSFRGFAQSGVGPRQIGNDGDTDAIGAQSYAIATAELTFPVGLPEQWGIEGAAFTDFGTVFGSPEESVAKGVAPCNVGLGTDDCTVFDTMAFRASVGGGLIWQSPFGPLRFEVAYPLMKAKYDETEWFRFSIGTRF
ncbi:MAG: outer membrane protein assembly factor BamA [Aestuariivirga sp.]|nr:outer membrane protein assembly factor BamA [Aestuariivirga sp.]